HLVPRGEAALQILRLAGLGGAITLEEDLVDVELQLPGALRLSTLLDTGHEVVDDALGRGLRPRAHAVAVLEALPFHRLAPRDRLLRRMEDDGAAREPEAAFA